MISDERIKEIEEKSSKDILTDAEHDDCFIAIKELISERKQLVAIAEAAIAIRDEPTESSDIIKLGLITVMEAALEKWERGII